MIIIGIILLIFKIILYIILFLLLLIIALLAIVSLSNLKYNGSGSYKDSDIDFCFKFRWLFGFIRAEYSYNNADGGNFQFTLPFNILKKKKSDIEAFNDDFSEDDFYNESYEDDSDIENFNDEDFETDENIKSSISNTSEIKDNSIKEPESIPETNDSGKIKKKKPKKTKRTTGKKQKKEKPDIIATAKEKYNQFIAIKERYDIPLIWKLFTQYLLKQLKALGFKGGHLSGIIGLSDPAMTGTALGAVSVISVFLPLEINIDGNFEKTIFSAEGDFNGKTSIFKLSLPLIGFILKKPILTIIKDILWHN